jgi:uncharacterized protein YcbK (DUF882 family)
MPRIPQYRQPDAAPNLSFPQVVEGAAFAAPGRALQGLGNAVADMGEGLQSAMNRQMRLQQAAVADRQEEVTKLTKNYWDAEFYRWQGNDTVAGQEFAKSYGDHGIGYTKAEAARMEKSIQEFIGTVPKEFQADYTERAMQYRLGRLKGAANDEDRMGNDFAVTSGGEIWDRAYAPRLTGDDKADQAVLDDFITNQVTNGPGNAGTKERLANTVREDYARRKFRALYDRDPDAAEQIATRATALATNAKGVKQSVISAWDRVQQNYGKTFDVVSGYRSPEHNARVGGAKHSQHIHGNAIDINTSMLSPEEKTRLIEIASAEGFQGIGVYKNNIHLDMGSRRAWGANYTSATVPGWARGAIAKHMANTARAPAPTGPAPTGGDNQPQWAGWLPPDEARAFVSERKKEADIAAKEQRETALKDIYDAAYRGDPIDMMLEERRDVIPASDYGRLRGLAARQRKEMDGDAGSPDRIAYADLLRRAVDDDDQGDVQDDAVDAYRQGYISKTDLNKVFTLSRNATTESGAKPWAREVRKTLNAQLTPASVAEPEQYDRRMQAVFAFDDWVRDNPEATRDQAVVKARELTTEYSGRDIDDLRKSLPMPFGSNVGRYAMSPEQLPLSAAMLRDAYASKKISEDQFRQQVEVLKKWKAMFDEEARNGQP